MNRQLESLKVGAEATDEMNRQILYFSPASFRRLPAGVHLRPEGFEVVSWYGKGKRVMSPR